VDSTLESGDALRLPPREARHVLKALRGRDGDILEVVDADRRLFLAELRGGGEAYVFEALEAPDHEDLDLSLYQAVPKGGRMDLVVEKATEVGATRIVPLVTERGVVRPRGGKVERWRRVAEAAARQSLRLRVPEVAEPLSFSEAVREVKGGVLLHNAPDLEPLEAVIRLPASLFVGPEGGWSEDELRVAEEAGLVLAQLGPYRLRSETAGMVATVRARVAVERYVRRP
jgi:16S rRNA (uracil1498-N3)-methyltransferase